MYQKENINQDLEQKRSCLQSSSTEGSLVSSWESFSSENNLAFFLTFNIPVTESAVFSIAFRICSRVSSSSTRAALLLKAPREE